MRVSHNQTNGYLAASQQDETEERQHFSAVKQQRRKKNFCLEREKRGHDGDNGKQHQFYATQQY